VNFTGHSGASRGKGGELKKSENQKVRRLEGQADITICYAGLTVEEFTKLL